MEQFTQVLKVETLSQEEIQRGVKEGLEESQRMVVEKADELGVGGERRQRQKEEREQREKEQREKEVREREINNFIESKIITRLSDKEMLVNWLSMQTGNDNSKRGVAPLIYRASQDGFGANDFHSKVDNKGSTLVVIRSDNGSVFGGYAHPSWTSRGECIGDSTKRSFIFSLDKKRLMTMSGVAGLFILILISFD